MAFALKRTLAVGRANRANTKPAVSAIPKIPNIDSSVIKTFAAVDAGTMCPYPTVDNVCTLKKNARANEWVGLAPRAPSRAPGPRVR